MSYRCLYQHFKNYSVISGIISIQFITINSLSADINAESDLSELMMVCINKHIKLNNNTQFKYLCENCNTRYKNIRMNYQLNGIKKSLFYSSVFPYTLYKIVLFRNNSTL